MDIATLSELISTVAFPIVACVYMAYLVHEMNDKHEQEMDSMRQALDANTNAINKLETLINQLMISLGQKGA